MAIYHYWLRTSNSKPSPAQNLFKTIIFMVGPSGSYGWFNKISAITKTTFLLGTLSLCSIPPLACFWSKDEILNDSRLYSPIFANNSLL